MNRATGVMLCAGVVLICLPLLIAFLLVPTPHHPSSEQFPVQPNRPPDVLNGTGKPAISLEDNGLRGSDRGNPFERKYSHDKTNEGDNKNGTSNSEEVVTADSNSGGDGNGEEVNAGTNPGDEESGRDGTGGVEKEESSSGSNNRPATSSTTTQKTHDLTSLRYLGFGTSLTWGEKLQNRTTDTYLARLSPTHRNLGVPFSNADYPAVCTYSMVGENDLYEVIILEFFMQRAKKLTLLARRLQQRFPKAFIIFLEVWTLYQYKEINSGLNMKEWAVSNGFHSHTKSTDLARHLVEHTSPLDWRFDPKLYALEVDYEAIETIEGSHLVRIPEPPNAHEALLKYGRFFDDDMVHHTAIGHEYIAAHLRNELRKFDFPHAHQYHTRPWLSKDLCHMWYDNGVDAIDHDPSIVMNEFQPGRWALEIPPEGGSISVNNPLEGGADVFIQYMKSGPEQEYPKTTFQLPKLSPVTVEPINIHAHPHHHIHVATQLVYLGTVNTGITELVIKPIEVTKYPFRVLSLAVTTADFRGFFDPTQPQEVETVITLT